jgi:hypothetical protein
MSHRRGGTGWLTLIFLKYQIGSGLKRRAVLTGRQRSEVGNQLRVKTYERNGRHGGQ